MHEALRASARWLCTCIATRYPVSNYHFIVASGVAAKLHDANVTNVPRIPIVRRYVRRTYRFGEERERGVAGK